MPTVRLADFTCAYDDRGSGVPILWVHGFPFHRGMWAPQFDALAGTVRMIAPDLRGFGESERMPGPYRMETLADDLARLLDALALEAAVVAGLSMGGYVAFALLRRHPGRLRGLVLADTRADPDTPEARERRRATAARVLSHGMDPLIEDLLPRLLSEETRRERPAVVAQLRAIMAAAHPASAAAALDGMAARSDSRDLLRHIRVPTCVIVGGEDALSPVETARSMAEAIPGARLVLIPGAGHVPNLERPDLFHAALREWLREAELHP